MSKTKKVESMARKQTDPFKRILEEKDKEKRAFHEKATTFLKQKKFFDKELQEKTEYLISQEGQRIIAATTKEGFSLIELANILEMTQNDLHEARNSHPEIYDAIDWGYTNRDLQVVNALHKIATGYKYDEKTIHTTQRGQRTMSKEITTTKEVPPNVKAIEYWLNNKKSYEFKKDTDTKAIPESNRFSIDVVFGGNEDDGE